MASRVGLRWRRVVLTLVVSAVHLLALDGIVRSRLGEGAGQHHRLGDRFHPSGAADHRLPGGVVLHIGRDADPARAQAWCAAAGWSELMRLAQGPALRGCVAEGLGDRVAVYSWTGLPRKGQQRWLDLVAVAEGLDALIPFAHVHVQTPCRHR